MMSDNNDNGADDVDLDVIDFDGGGGGGGEYGNSGMIGSPPPAVSDLIKTSSDGSTMRAGLHPPAAGGSIDPDEEYNYDYDYGRADDTAHEDIYAAQLESRNQYNTTMGVYAENDGGRGEELEMTVLSRGGVGGEEIEEGNVVSSSSPSSYKTLKEDDGDDGETTVVEMEETHQFTWRATLVGSFLGAFIESELNTSHHCSPVPLITGILVAASNQYLGLRIGWTFGASLFGAIVGFAILRPISRYLPSYLGGYH